MGFQRESSPTAPGLGWTIKFGSTLISQGGSMDDGSWVTGKQSMCTHSGDHSGQPAGLSVELDSAGRQQTLGWKVCLS